MTQPPSSNELVQALLQPEAYPQPPESVELKETHISWVFLTPDEVYKLKKPVDMDFLDFSTLEKRWEACRNEVELNRRLAPHVYLGVVPVTADAHGRIRIGGEGPALDWLVHMRRLPADEMLDRLIARGALTPDQIDRLAQFLADFYSQLPPLDISAKEYRRQLEVQVRDNRRELLRSEHQLPTVAVKRAHNAQLSLLMLRPEQFDERVARGRIVDGHGDLRPEHVCLDHEPVVFDCIEFNARLRRIDIADELAFLAMECQMLGAETVGQRVLQEYTARSGDRPHPALWAFYTSYRACVRAKVAALRAEQLADVARKESLALASRYLELANTAAADVARPLVIVVRGLMGAGKSTLATALAEGLGADLLQTDALRRELLGASPAEAAYGEGRYRPELRRHVYDEMFTRAAALLAAGQSVVLDATFLSRRLRRRALELAAAHQAQGILVHCWCPEEVARQRIISRQLAGPTESEARPELLVAQAAEEEDDPPGAPATQIDTTQPLQTQLQEVYAALSRLAEA